MVAPWQLEKVELFGYQQLPADSDVPGSKIVSVPCVIDLRAQRPDCGCASYTGMRLDRREIVWGIEPCSVHHEVAVRTLNRLKGMPPSDEEINALTATIFEEELLR